jgi:hypothetical protein
MSAAPGPSYAAAIGKEHAMAVHTPPRPRTRDRIAPVAAALLVVSAMWYALILEQITVPAAPRDTGSTADAVRAWYVWQSIVQRQQWVVSVVAVLGLAGVAVTVARRAGERPSARHRSAVIAAASGAGAWAAGTLLQIGGQRAVGLMATHSNPIETVNAIAFTVDTATAVFEAAALAALGAGLLALATATAPGAPRLAGIVTGVLVVLLGVAYAVDNGDVTNVCTVVVGGLVLPGWLLLARGGEPAVAW